MKSWKKKKKSHQCLNGAINRNDPEREGEGGRGFSDVLFAQIYIRCCFPSLTRCFGSSLNLPLALPD